MLISKLGISVIYSEIKRSFIRFILPRIEVYITAIFMRHLGIKDANRPFSLYLNSYCAKWVRRMEERNALFTPETQSYFFCCIPAIAKCAFNISNIVHFS